MMMRQCRVLKMFIQSFSNVCPAWYPNLYGKKKKENTNNQNKCIHFFNISKLLTSLFVCLFPCLLISRFNKFVIQALYSFLWFVFMAKKLLRDIILALKNYKLVISTENTKY